MGYSYQSLHFKSFQYHHSLNRQLPAPGLLRLAPGFWIAITPIPSWLPVIIIYDGLFQMIEIGCNEFWIKQGYKRTVRSFDECEGCSYIRAPFFRISVDY